MHPPGQPSGEPTLRDRLVSAGLLLAAIAGVFSTVGEVIAFRRSFGCRYFDGLKLLAPLGLVPVFAAFWPNPREGGVWVLALIPLYLVRCGMHRFTALKLRWRARRTGISEPLVHSRYNGVSTLTRWFPKDDEIVLKRVKEPLVAFIAAMMAMTVAPALGWFLIFTAIGMGVHTRLLLKADRQKTLDMTDSMLESEWLAARVREQIGEGRRNCWRKP